MISKFSALYGGQIERYKWFAPFGVVRYADAEGRPWGTPGTPTRLPTIRDGVAQKAWGSAARRRS